MEPRPVVRAAAQTTGSQEGLPMLAFISVLIDLLASRIAFNHNQTRLG
jgi:hypothetical protein